MRAVQHAFLPVAASLVGGRRAVALSMSDGEEAKGIRVVIRTWLLAQENRRKALLLVWVFFVIISVIVTAGSLGVSQLICKSSHPGIWFAVGWWALFVGLVVLFFLPSKVVTSLFGGLIGIGASETLSGNGLISRLDGSIQSIAINLKGFLADAGEFDVHFMRLMIKFFLAIVLLLCLPAFFTSDSPRDS